MNRFQLQSSPPPPPPVASTHQPMSLDHSLLHTSDHRGLPYSLFGPLHYEPNYAYPLIIWLHGTGGDERQLQRIMPLVSMRNYVSISARAPRPVEPPARGYQWTQSDRDVCAAEQSVFDCLELASARYRIARQRVFLAGYDSGGTMALRVGLKNPRRFAGALSLGGPFPIGHTPLLFIETARRLPLFITQGRRSSNYCEERTCEELRLFHSAGMMHVTLRIYPCGDELNTGMLHDMNVWIMEQVTGVSSSPAEDLSPQLDDEA
jgi:phospholipase/carboxylesterase